jgi:hypothetical protein
MQAVQLIEAFAAGSPDRDGRHQGDFYRRIKPECGNGVKRDSKTVDSWSDRPMRGGSYDQTYCGYPGIEPLCTALR